MSKRIIIPAYDPYPGPEWDVIFEHADDIAYVVLNCASGVGAAIDHVYVAMAAQLKAANIKTLGYVSSRYGARPIGEVQREIGLWFAWYKCDGIFCDEMDYKPTSLPYYRRVKSATGSSILVTNPGSVPDESYRDLDAIICVAETDEQSYLAKTFPEWTKNRPHNVAHIVFGVTEPERVLAKIDDNNVEFYYLTSVGGHDPQFSVPATIWPPTESAPTPAEDPNWAVIALQEVAVALQAPAGSTLGDVPALAQQRMSELVQLRANASSVIGIATNSELLAEVGKRMAHPAYA